MLDFTVLVSFCTHSVIFLLLVENFAHKSPMMRATVAQMGIDRASSLTTEGLAVSVLLHPSVLLCPLARQFTHTASYKCEWMFSGG